MTVARSTTSTRVSAGRNLMRIFWLEAKYEFLKMIRIPIFAISTVVFPLMFYTLFGLMFGNSDAGGVSMSQYLLATYGVFGIVGAALFGFGVGIASERGQGWMRLKRASAMPPMAYFSAKMFVAVVFSGLVVLGLFLLGYSLGGVRMPLLNWLLLLVVLLIGSFPFAAMGLMFGYLVGPNSAPAILNLIYLPMAFASGLWMPIEMLPSFVQALAPWLPPYHLAQVALDVVGNAQSDGMLIHVVWLLGYTLLFLNIAVVLYRRDEGKTYG